MERWHQVHDVRTQQEWQAEQPKTEHDQWDAWRMAALQHTMTGVGKSGAETVPYGALQRGYSKLVLDDTYLAWLREREGQC